MLLSDLTTIRVGGPAGMLVSPGTRDELVATALDVWASGDEWLVLGGGSNVVVGDQGFDGSVIRVLTKGIWVLPIDEASRDATAVHLRVEAGDLSEPGRALDLDGRRVQAGARGGCGVAAGVPHATDRRGDDEDRDGHE